MVGRQPTTAYQINETSFLNRSAATNPNNAPRMTPTEFARIENMPRRNIPRSGPLKKPITATAASTIEPIPATYTPMEAKVTTTPQAKVTQRALPSVTSFEFDWKRLSRWMKSTQVTVLKEFKPEENT